MVELVVSLPPKLAKLSLYDDGAYRSAAGGVCGSGGLDTVEFDAENPSTGPPAPADTDIDGIPTPPLPAAVLLLDS